MNIDLFSCMKLRDDIATGPIPLEQFAANLNDVINDTGPDVYREPALFFESSHPSLGMRDLLNDGLGRLGGINPGANSVVRLETTLGGGKTHSLIALYHAARRHLPPGRLAEFVDTKYELRAPVTAIAAFIGDRTGATSFPNKEGIQPRTLWGHLALQLGGAASYELIKRHDEQSEVPGADVFIRVLGDRPALIMLDELGFYFRAASGVAVAGTTLAKLTTAFIMALVAAVKDAPRAFLVVTTTETTDVFGDEINELLIETRELLARVERSIRPTAESDLPAILRRRLFATDIDQRVVTTVAQKYVDAAQEATAAGATLSSDATSATWAADIDRCYPFHPALIDVLDKRLATMPNFQRTRGALRLVALGLRQLWDSPAKAANRRLLVHLDSLDLTSSEIVNDVTSRIDRAAFKHVIEADIASMSGTAHAQAIDAASGDSYARAIATTIYYWSLTKDIPGVLESGLITSMLSPGFEYQRFQRALEKLTQDQNQAAWYLNNDPFGGYLFSTEASPVKALQEHRAAVKANDVALRAQALLEGMFSPISGIKLRKTWLGDSIPDNSKDCQLVIYHWDSFDGSKGIPPTSVPKRILDDWKLAPTGGPRHAVNRLVFLAPDPSTHGAMLTAVRHELGLKSLIDSSAVMSRFTQEQQEKLRTDAKTHALLAKVGVASHFSVLLYPGNPNLVRTNLPAPSESSFANNQTERIVEQLDKDDKILRAGSPSPSVKFLKDKLGQFFTQAQTTADIVERFATKADLKIILDPEPLRETIRRGIADGAWDYHDTTTDRWATKERPSGANITISSESFVEPAGSAPAPSLPTCPLCGTQHGPHACPTSPGGSEGETFLPAPVPSRPTFSKRGAPAPVLKQLLAEARDLKLALKAITFQMTEPDKSRVNVQFARFVQLVPAGIKGVALRYEIQATATLSDPGDKMKLEFIGTDADLSPVKTMLDALYRKPVQDATLTVSLTATFAEALATDATPINDIISRASNAGPDDTLINVATEALTAA